MDLNQRQASANELFFVVDESDRPLSPLPRRLVHGHGVWHRIAHVWFVNRDHEVLCQQRALTKELNPGYWEAFFGGHLKPGESYLEAAKREAYEELGLVLEAGDLHFWKIYRYAHPLGSNNEFQAVFVVRWDGSLGDLRFLDSEVAQVTWETVATIRTAITNGAGNWTNCGYELMLLDELSTSA